MTNIKPFLILLPFAGGNAYSYRPLLASLATSYELVTPELPGRGSLTQQPLIDNIEELVDYLFKGVFQTLDLSRGYVSYGHSMGALVAYLLTHKINQSTLPKALHLVISGHKAPCFKRKTIIHNLPSAAFWEKLKNKGGIPNEVLENKELREYFEPIIRNDFKLVETYQYEIAQHSLNLPMTVIYGDQDDMDDESVYAWQQENKKTIKFMQMHGNHFFIYNHVATLTKYINSLVNQ